MVRQMDILVVRRGGGEATGPVGPDGVSSCVQSEANFFGGGDTVHAYGKEGYMRSVRFWARQAKPIWRCEVEQSAAAYAVVANKANSPRFWVKNAVGAEKQSQLPRKGRAGRWAGGRGCLGAPVLVDFSGRKERTIRWCM